MDRLIPFEIQLGPLFDRSATKSSEELLKTRCEAASTQALMKPNTPGNLQGHLSEFQRIKLVRMTVEDEWDMPLSLAVPIFW
jgi:hypothetical protein